jgi:hypothetical protein
MILRSIVSAGAILFVLSLVTAQPAYALRVGYNEDATRLLAVPRAVKHSNTQIARVNFSWPQIEPADGEFEWSTLDRVMALFRKVHIRPIITIFGSPDWTGPDRPGIQCPCDRAADPYWIRMWQALAQRYPDAILGVWNEPNIPSFGSVKIDRMAELVNEAANAIWSVTPGRRVLGPPVSPVGDWASYGRELYSKLDRRVELAANAYPYARAAGKTTFDQLMANLGADLARFKRIAGRRQVWITETNVSRYDVSPRRQTRYIRHAYRLAKNRGIAGMIVYRLWSAWSPDDGIFAWDAGLSALASNGDPRPLYNQVGRLHRGFRPLAGEVVTGPPPPSPVVAPVSSLNPCPDSL